MTSVFDVLAANDDSHRIAGRVALRLADKRVNDQFGAFLRRTANDDQVARLSLIVDDFNNVVKQACEDAGYDDWKSIADTIWENRTRVEAQTKEASVHEARRPKLCPYHSEVVDISLASGDATAGFNAMSGHAWGEKHCQGGFEDKCNFKPQMVTQSYWDDKKEKAEQRRQEREQQQAEQFEAPQLVDEVDDEGNVELEDAGIQVEEPVALDTSDTMGGETQEEVGLTQDELMAVAASFRHEALGGPINRNRDAQPYQGPNPQDIHSQFSQMFGQPGGGAQHQPGAHTQQNYDALAGEMGLNPTQVQEGLRDFYQGQKQRGLSQGMMTADEMANPNSPGVINAQQELMQTGQMPGQVPQHLQNLPSPAVGVQPARPLMNGTKPLQPTPPAGQFRQTPLAQRPTSNVHEAAEPYGDNLGPIEHQTLPKGDGDGVGGPSPKIDKRTWTPQAFNKPIDTEHPDSPVPTKRIDVQPDLNEPAERPENADRRNPGKLEGIGENTLEKQDVTKAQTPSPVRNNNGWAGTSAPKGDPTPFPA